MIKKENVYSIISVVVIICSLYFIISIISEQDRQLEIEIQIKKDNVIQMGKILEQHRFFLKETNVDGLIGGIMKGSFLLASGSIYGEVTENKYLSVVYFDDDKIIDNTTDVYRITKFDLETIQIVTIPKNETPYYKFVENSWQHCDWKESCYYKLKIGTPRLFLSEGWAILNGE